MKDTSRTAALDYLLAIGNLVALADHKEEQIMNLEEEYEAVASLELTEPEAEQMRQNIAKEILETKASRRQLYDLRRELQRNFFQRYEIDMDYWCQYKHFAVALTAAEECRNADDTYYNEVLVTKLRKAAYQFLGTAMWVGPANCGRCLADMLDEKPIPTDPNINPEPTSPFTSDNW